MHNAFLLQASRKYLLNCFILALPVLIWNVVLTDKLPAAFQPGIFRRDISPLIMLVENVSRSMLFLIMLLFPLQMTDRLQRRGLLVYLAGLLMYFSSWLMIIYFPDTPWSRSRSGFLAPAYTPLIWLAGIGMLSGKPFIALPFIKQSYLIIAIVFTIFHCEHP